MEVPPWGHFYGTLIQQTPYRSRLEAAIQGVPGVLGVSGITYRRRGSFAGFIDLPEAVTPSTRQILRVDNDPSWPERGTIRVIVEGGR